MKLTSLAFEDDQLIPSVYTCDGENISPPLKISDLPKEAKSLVLTIQDPDAPSGIWTHWLVWNIKPTVANIDADTVPEGSVIGTNSFGAQSYGGPCPPSGIHHYVFKLYALDTMISLSPSATVKDLEEAMVGHILELTELVGLYQRQ